jgi:hypothetical protein
LIKQAEFTNFCKLKAIIIQLLNPANESNIPLWEVAFYQLKQCHIQQGLNQKLQILPFPSFSPLQLNTPTDKSQICNNY